MKNTAVITGASRGIGLALAKKMLNNGYIVVGTSRDGTIEAIDHDNFYPMTLNLKDKNSIKEFANLVTERIRGINILINNAGVGPDLGNDLPDPDTFEETFKVNVNGTVFLTEQLIPKVIKNGKIVMISSKLGSIASTEAFDSVAYKMSKSALNMYTKILSIRLSRIISVAAIDPGWVKTEIRASNLIHAPLTPKESAENIYRFITSNYKSGTYWDTVNNKMHNW